MEKEFRGIKSISIGDRTQTELKGTGKEVIECFAAIVSSLRTGEHPIPEPLLRAVFEAGLLRANDEKPAAMQFPFAPPSDRSMKFWKEAIA